MQKGNRIIQHGTTTFKVSHMKGKKDIVNSKLITCFSQPKSVSLVQPVVTGIDDAPSASSVQPLTVSISQKKKKKILKQYILLKIMFSDSQIASEFKMSRTKLIYLINFGVAPYFWQMLVYEIDCCSFLTMSFDENLNKVRQPS